MAIVIGMTGLIAALTFNEARHLVEKDRAKNAISDIRDIYIGSVAYYDSYGDYSMGPAGAGDTVRMSYLCDDNVYIDSNICGGSNGAGTGPWNGDYTATEGHSDPTQIRITLSNVPEKYGLYIQRELLTDVTINSTGTEYDSGTHTMTVYYYRSV